MADQGVVQKKEFNRNGTLKFQISGKWYFLGRSATPGEFPPGTAIEFEWEEFGEDRGRGKPRAIKSWQAAQQRSGSSGAPQIGSTVTDVDYLRSVSNIVSAAIQSGLVKEVEGIEKACVAARMGLFRAMSKAKYESDEPERQQEPEFDDDIPF